VSERQSEVITSREILETRMAELRSRYEGSAAPKPDFWGGYRLIPVTFEFWQGRRSRLHDRIRYRAEASEGGHPAWIRERLSP
jgi:pyridoxamine 5'-phosphate oxidase